MTDDQLKKFRNILSLKRILNARRLAIQNLKRNNEDIEEGLRCIQEYEKVIEENIEEIQILKNEIEKREKQNEQFKEVIRKVDELTKTKTVL
jgi:hypothetical protein